MARQRMLHPGFFTDAELLSLSPLHRLLFEGLWCVADREGRLKDKPLELKIQLLPADNCDVDAMLNDLAACGRIARYGHDRKRFIQVIRFTDYQKPHPKELPSSIPSMHDLLGETRVEPKQPCMASQVRPDRADSKTESESESETESIKEAPLFLTAHQPTRPNPPVTHSVEPAETEQAFKRPETAIPAKPPPDPTTAPKTALAAPLRPPDGQSLADLLAAEFRTARGADYSHTHADEQAMRRIPPEADDAEVLRRWRIGLRKRWPTANSLVDLVRHWNAYAAADPPPGAKPERPPGYRKLEFVK